MLLRATACIRVRVRVGDEELRTNFLRCLSNVLELELEPEAELELELEAKNQNSQVSDNGLSARIESSQRQPRQEEKRGARSEEKEAGEINKPTNNLS